MLAEDFYVAVSIKVLRASLSSSDLSGDLPRQLPCRGKAPAERRGAYMDVRTNSVRRDAH